MLERSDGNIREHANEVKQKKTEVINDLICDFSLCTCTCVFIVADMADKGWCCTLGGAVFTELIQ